MRAVCAVCAVVAIGAVLAIVVVVASGIALGIAHIPFDHFPVKIVQAVFAVLQHLHLLPPQFLVVQHDRHQCRKVESLADCQHAVRLNVGAGIKPFERAEHVIDFVSVIVDERVNACRAQVKS